MIVYCDTSFIFSQLNDDDALHAAANATVRRFSGEEFVVCDIHFLELPAPARVAT
jgi:hypothetical protein